MSNACFFNQNKSGSQLYFLAPLARPAETRLVALLARRLGSLLLAQSPKATSLAARKSSLLKSTSGRLFSKLDFYKKGGVAPE